MVGPTRRPARSGSISKAEHETWWFAHRTDVGDSESKKFVAWLTETEACLHTRCEPVLRIEEVEVTVRVDQTGQNGLTVCLNHSDARNADAC